ncbi:MAG: ABC transporter permease subunit [Pseudomonadota bacterium]
MRTASQPDGDEGSGSQHETVRPKVGRPWRLWLWQALIAACVLWLLVGMVLSTQRNLDTLGITSGFGFLDRSTGWGYSFSLIPRSIDDTYRRTLTIGFLNTLFLGLLCIALSTVAGFIIGSVRDARNLALASVAACYIQLFRNIPLILQAVFWYAAFIHLPGPRQAMSLSDLVFLSNRGLLLPMLNVPLWAGLALLVGSLALAAGLVWRRVAVVRALVLWLTITVIACAVAALTLAPADQGAWSIPALKGLRFRGGLTVSMELLAMVVAITLYSSAYIAEVVRGGLEEVPRGQIEAGQSLGLSSARIWWEVKLPLALRSIIPPLGNQWIFVMKATTVGVAIGFSDLFMIVSTSITQSGQTLELIALLMAAFLLINVALARVVDWLNARMQFKGH